MAYPIGIDLGTTNSVVCVRCRGVVETILVDGRRIMPSAISVRQDGTILIGRPAKSRTIVEPAYSITSAKRYIGDAKTEWTIMGTTYTPVDVSALILGRLKEAAEAHLGERVTEAVITVPAYFNNNQKRDTKAAAEKVGLQVLRLLPEPTAATISYGLDKGHDQTLLVYDLGGGTFDVSVLRVTGNQFTVLAVDGDFHLGGDDFDLLLVDYFIGLVEQRTKADLSFFRRLFRPRQSKEDPVTSQEILLARQRLKEAVEQAKIELSESDSTRVTISEILGTSLDEEITLKNYNRMIGPLVQRTIDKIHDVLTSAGLTAADVDRVVLVGGSTRNRLVRERVAEAVKEPWIAERVDEVVAEGAAIVANSLGAPDEDLAPIEFYNVTPFDLGVRATNDGDTDFFEVLIPKNSQVPTAIEKDFTTSHSNQKTVDISVFQGEHPQCRENTFIGGFRLEGIPHAQKGQPKIVVQFSMDESDLLTVSATCSHLRSEKTLDVNLVSREDELPRSGPEADIMFLIDTSGSMSTELAGVKQSGLDFANSVIEGGIDCRLGLVDFDKPAGSHYKWQEFGPMDPPQFPAAISGLRIGRLGGCGCYIGTKDTIPVIEAFVRSFPSEDRLKIGILVSDEVGNDAQAVQRIVSILRNANVCLHVLGVPRSCHEVLAKETGGKFWDILASRGHADFSKLLEALASEITNLALR